MEGLKVHLAGDSAIVVEFGSSVEVSINKSVIAFADAIRKARYEGVRDVMSAYCSVTVYFDPVLSNLKRLTSELERLSENISETTEDSARLVKIPVVYGGEYGPDLEEVAAFGECSEAELIELHSRSDYRVYMIGFLPGFAYMGPVDSRIAMPRREAPRLKVPKGTVGIAGKQTGIYPMESPGGWRLIGRTPLSTFDSKRSEPFLIRAGDTVKFESILEDEFEVLEDASVKLSAF